MSKATRVEVWALALFLVVLAVIGGGGLEGKASKAETRADAAALQAKQNKIAGRQAKLERQRTRSRLTRLTRRVVVLGPKGDRGGTGATGRQGATGQAGDRGAAEVGPIGREGPMGLPGLTPAPGKDGEDGKDGIDGKDGAPGKDGIDGQDGATGPEPDLTGRTWTCEPTADPLDDPQRDTCTLDP